MVSEDVRSTERGLTEMVEALATGQSGEKGRRAVWEGRSDGAQKATGKPESNGQTDKCP